MNGIVISIGGLNVGDLGCYGNGWLATPGFDRLAAEDFVFDQCFVDSLCPSAARRAWWTGEHQFFRRSGCAPDSAARQENLISLVRASGIRAILIRDTQELFNGPLHEAEAFNRIIEFNRSEEDTAHQVFGAAKQWIEREAAAERFLLFLDCYGVHPPWLPNRDESCREEDSADKEDFEEVEDIREPDTAEAPDPSESCPDEATRLHADAVAHVDDQLAKFLEFLRAQSAWGHSLVLVTSDMGISLRDQRPENSRSFEMHGERVHVPLLLHLPGAHDPASRSPALVQSIDLMATVLDALGVPIPFQVHGRSLLPIVRLQQRELRGYACMGTVQREWAIRTPDWHFVLPLSGQDPEPPPQPKLFVLPDDRWQRNDVARQFLDVSERLERTLRDLARGD